MLKILRSSKNDVFHNGKFLYNISSYFLLSLSPVQHIS